MKKNTRPYYKDIDYRPFIYCVVFGGPSEDLALDTQKYNIRGVPEGLEIFPYSSEKDRAHVSEVLTAYKRADRGADERLVEKCRKAENGIFLIGEIKDDTTLDYMQDTIGIIQAFMDKGAFGVFDAQTFTLYNNGA